MEKVKHPYLDRNLFEFPKRYGFHVSVYKSFKIIQEFIKKIEMEENNSDKNFIIELG